MIDSESTVDARRRETASDATGIRNQSSEARPRGVALVEELEHLAEQVVLDRGGEEVVLVGEVPVDGALRQARAPRDRLQRRRVVTAVGQLRQRGVQQPRPGRALQVGRAAVAPGRGLGGCHLTSVPTARYV